MRRILATCIAIGLALALPGSVAAAPTQPRVAIIVGPAEGLTDLYRSVGAAAAREARRWTNDVVMVASPDATWPAVKRALRGASIVVYLGHGNGFPSPYRSSPYPTHPERSRAQPGRRRWRHTAISTLASRSSAGTSGWRPARSSCSTTCATRAATPSRACPRARSRSAVNGSTTTRRAWLKAGAGAVIADTFGEPGSYLRAILSGDRSIDAVWRDAPTFHDHVLTFASLRTPGATAAMDPTQPDSGFNRSIVWRPGLSSSDVRAGAGRVATLPLPPIGSTDPGLASLAALGVTFGTPSLVPAGPTPAGLVAGSRVTLSLPIKAPSGVRLPTGLELGLRWDPLVLDPRPSTTGDAGDPAEGGSPSPGPSAGTTGPEPSCLDSSERRPAAARPTRPEPGSRDSTRAGLGEPPAIALVVPEALGTMITPARAKLTRSRLRLTAALPTNSGTYRLTTTVHGSDGLAFDAATQALVPVLTVRVSRPLSVAYGVVPDLAMTAGTNLALPVRLVNDGIVDWALPPIASDDLIDPMLARSRPPARLVARWVALGLGTTADTTDSTTPLRLDPGSETTVRADPHGADGGG